MTICCVLLEYDQRPRKTQTRSTIGGRSTIGWPINDRPINTHIDQRSTHIDQRSYKLFSTCPFSRSPFLHMRVSQMMRTHRPSCPHTSANVDIVHISGSACMQTLLHSARVIPPACNMLHTARDIPPVCNLLIGHHVDQPRCGSAFMSISHHVDQPSC